MRNVMQEQDVTDWKARLAAYVPETEQERRDRNEILLAAEQYGTQLLWRSHAESHFTCSWILSWTPGWKRCWWSITASTTPSPGRADTQTVPTIFSGRRPGGKGRDRHPKALSPHRRYSVPGHSPGQGAPEKRHTRSGTPALQRDLRADCRYQRDAAHRPGRKHRRGLDPRGKAAGDLQRTSYAPGV